MPNSGQAVDDLGGHDLGDTGYDRLSDAVADGHVKERGGGADRSVLAAGSAGLNRRHVSSGKPRRSDPEFPWLRESLREDAFFGGLREFTGKTTGISIEPHGSFGRALREYREITGAGIIACSLSDPLDSMADRMGFADGVKYTPKDRHDAVSERGESVLAP